MENHELIEIIQQLAQWHKNKVALIEMIVNKTDADIDIPQLDIHFAADSSEAKWLRLGAHLALLQIQKFPVQFNQPADDEDEDGDDE